MTPHECFSWRDIILYWSLVQLIEYLKLETYIFYVAKVLNPDWVKNCHDWNVTTLQYKNIPCDFALIRPQLEEKLRFNDAFQWH